MNLDAILLYAGILADAAVIVLLFYRRLWRTLPFFCAYSIWILLGSSLGYVVLHYFPTHYFTTFFFEESLDNALQFCVLVELSWSVLRPLRASLPRSTPWVLGILIAAAGLLIWPLADSSTFAQLHRQWHFFFHLRQTVSILRILFFLVLAGCSQLLSIGWQDRELQVATGLGFYSFFALATTVLHSHLSGEAQYNRLDKLLVASYVCSLLYLAYCFSRKEAERREFTPQMQTLLLAVAGTARTSRIALTDPQARKRREP